MGKRNERKKVEGTPQENALKCISEIINELIVAADKKVDINLNRLKSVIMGRHHVSFLRCNRVLSVPVWNSMEIPVRVDGVEPV